MKEEEEDDDGKNWRRLRCKNENLSYFFNIHLITMSEPPPATTTNRFYERQTLTEAHTTINTWV